MHKVASILRWSCSVSSVATALLLVTLALHGFAVGRHPEIVENSGPYGLTVHMTVLAIAAIFATWIAAPLWLLSLIGPFGRLKFEVASLQIGIFIAGWMLTLPATFLLEVSPAALLF